MRRSDSDSVSAARVFRALGDPTRMRLVALLSQRELCVCHLVLALGLPQSTVSRHLGVLKAAGVVGVRRDGSWMHYRLAQIDDAVARGALASASAQLRKRPGLAREVRRLVASCGPGACE